MDYALILSGGSGKRLWPLSRRARPKHLISLAGASPLLAQTLDRLDGLISPEGRYLITIPEQAPIVRDMARGRATGIIIEPMGKNNVLPMALSTKMVALRDPKARIVFLPADHNIRSPDKLQQALRRGLEVAGEGYIVTLGIPTACTEPNYGHVQRGDPIPGFGDGDYPAFAVKRFREKPPLDVAEKYSADENWFWNAGIFVFSASTMLELIDRCQPELSKLVDGMGMVLGRSKPTLENPVIDWASSPAIANCYRDLPEELETSIDFALMEKADRVATIPVEMGWSDLGGFAALAGLVEEDEEGNRIAPRPDGHEARALTPGSRDVALFPSKRAIICLDCSDLIVIDTPDALLILPRGSSRRVGEIVEEIRNRGWTNLL